MTACRRHDLPNNLEICIGGVGYQTEAHILLSYFEQYGTIKHYNFTAPNGGGLIFVTYEDLKSIDRCLNNRPHRLDGRHLYVKRALPFDAEHPREHIDTTRDLMIVIDSVSIDEQFLTDLREYFSSYGALYACKYCHETNFSYILVEFADYDQVDRIILDKPHFFNDQQLNVMKYLSSNKIHMNIKYSSHDSPPVAQDAVDVDNDQQFLQYELNYKRNLSEKTDNSISEIDLENEVYRLQNRLKKLTDDFTIKRKHLEEECCEQLRKLNDNADQTHRLQQDLEQEHAKLVVEYESLTHESDLLNEEYLTAELENFELTSYYEQILEEEKEKTARYEAEYTQQLQLLYDNDSSSPPSLPSSSSQTSTSPLPPAIPDDDDDD